MRAYTRGRATEIDAPAPLQELCVRALAPQSDSGSCSPPCDWRSGGFPFNRARPRVADVSFPVSRPVPHCLKPSRSARPSHKVRTCKYFWGFEPSRFLFQGAEIHPDKRGSPRIVRPGMLDCVASCHANRPCETAVACGCPTRGALHCVQCCALRTRLSHPTDRGDTRTVDFSANISIISFGPASGQSTKGLFLRLWEIVAAEIAAEKSSPATQRPQTPKCGEGHQRAQPDPLQQQRDRLRHSGRSAARHPPYIH